MKYLYGISIATILMLSGCATAEPKPIELKPSCNAGILSENNETCYITTKPLMGVVQNSQDLKDGKYLITVSDERGRKFKISSEQNMNVGDPLLIHLTSKPDYN